MIDGGRLAIPAAERLAATPGGCFEFWAEFVALITWCWAQVRDACWQLRATLKRPCSSSIAGHGVGQGNRCMHTGTSGGLLAWHGMSQKQEASVSVRPLQDPAARPDFQGIISELR